ncbi:Uncharacterised protein [Vibrio cholerae]|nr:Uncharacterised protein [Vibrio cholerae]
MRRLLCLPCRKYLIDRFFKTYGFNHWIMNIYDMDNRTS